jgi:c-di-GMP-binding flagellar brake protein YcgR
MVNTTEIRALLVTPDPWLVSNFISLCGELGIAAQKSATISIVPEELGQAKYEAVLVDFDTVPETLNILAGVRESRGNRNALVFAVATDTANRHQALRQGANFIFERPIDSNEIRRVLYAAYDLMARESRRYFRCTAELPALLGQANAGTDLRCTTINISSNGMALRTPSSLQLGEMVQIALFLPGAGQAVRASGTVVWDDKHGKTGINFQCGIPRDQSELDAWLNTRFYDLLTPRRATL